MAAIAKKQPALFTLPFDSEWLESAGYRVLGSLRRHGLIRSDRRGVWRRKT